MILPVHLYAWPQEWLELWHERAGIMEFEAGMSRSLAEKEAENDIRRIVERNQNAPSR